jgi:hypothetical protein
MWTGNAYFWSRNIHGEYTASLCYHLPKTKVVSYRQLEYHRMFWSYFRQVFGREADLRDETFPAYVRVYVPS